MKLHFLVLVAILLALYHVMAEAPKNKLLYPLWGISDACTKTLAEWSSVAWFSSLAWAAVTQDTIMFAYTGGMFILSAWKGNHAGHGNMFKIWTSCFLGMAGNAMSMIAKSLHPTLNDADSQYVVYRTCMIYTVITIQLLDIAVLQNCTKKTVSCFALVCGFAWVTLDITAEQFFQNFLLVLFVVKAIESDSIAKTFLSKMIACVKGNTASKICGGLVVAFILYEAYHNFSLSPPFGCGWNCLLEWINYAIANCTLAAMMQPFRYVQRA